MPWQSLLGSRVTGRRRGCVDWRRVRRTRTRAGVYCRWRRVDLQKLIAERFGVVYHEWTIGKVLKDTGFSHISARRRYPGQKPEVMEAYKNFAGTQRSSESMEG